MIDEQRLVELEEIEIELARTYRDLLWQNSREDLLSFICAVNKTYQVNWHHKIICDRLSLLPSQKQQRIMIFLPPQTGKSEIVSRNLPAWLLGMNPNLRIILASYTSDLAIGFCRDNQKLMLTEEYEGIFPWTFLSEKRVQSGPGWKRTANYFEIVENKGFMFSVGVGGSTTGKSADVFIVDDPFKDMQQASSGSTRRRIRDWFNSVAQTRLSLNGHVILMHTRWHDDDLAGQLLRESELDPNTTQWEVISIPAVGVEKAKFRHNLDQRKDGEPLWPSFKGDVEYLETVRKSVGERVWSALYQQNPTIEGGNIIREHWIEYYSQLPFQIHAIPSNRMIQSWDLTFKDTGTSYVVGVAIVYFEAKFYIIDFYRAKADVIKSMEAIRAMSSRLPNSTILIEDKANGPAVMSILKKELTRLIAVKPDASKDERLHVVAPFFEARNVVLPLNAPWTKEMVHELVSFPNSSNDDIVDAVSQGLQHWNKLSGIRRLEAMGNI